MKLKLATSFVFFLFLQLSVINGQINKEALMLGLMEDYAICHNEKNLKKTPFIVRVSNNEISLLNEIEKLTQLAFKQDEKKKNCLNCHNFSTLQIKDKKWKLKKYYTFEKVQVNGDSPSVKYCGSFKFNTIESWDKNSKISYLKGMVLRNRIKKEEIIKVKAWDSPTKHKLTKEFMLELGFTLKSEKIQDTTPMGYFLEFEMNEDLWNAYFK